MKTLGDKYKGKERQRTNLADRLGSFRLKDIGKALAPLALGAVVGCSSQELEHRTAQYLSFYNFASPAISNSSELSKFEPDRYNISEFMDWYDYKIKGERCFRGNSGGNNLVCNNRNPSIPETASPRRKAQRELKYSLKLVVLAKRNFENKEYTLNNYNKDYMRIGGGFTVKVAYTPEEIKKINEDYRESVRQLHITNSRLATAREDWKNNYSIYRRKN